MATPTAAQYVQVCIAQNGKPYVYATQGPDTFDCSGLVLYACQSVGITDCPRTSEDQWDWVSRCTAAQIEPGVLVFSNFPGEDSPGHVQICIGYGANSNYVGADNPSVGVEEGPISGDSTGGGVIVGYGYIPGLAYGGGATFSGGNGSANSTTSSGSNLPAGVSGLLAGAGAGGVVLVGGVVALVALGIVLPLALTGIISYARN